MDTSGPAVGAGVVVGAAVVLLAGAGGAGGGGVSAHATSTPATSRVPSTTGRVVIPHGVLHPPPSCKSADWPTSRLQCQCSIPQADLRPTRCTGPSPWPPDQGFACPGRTRTRCPR